MSGKRLDQTRQNELQPKRLEYAKEQLEAKGITPHYVDKTEIRFQFKGAEIKLFPYSGWHTGKTIVDGRGLAKLLKQL